MNTYGVWKSDRYTTNVVEGVESIHNNGKILVPVSLQERVLEWYHLLLLVYPVEKWMEATIRLVYTWPGLQPAVTNRCKTCHECCQMSKQRGHKKYGLLLEKKKAG